MNALEEGNRREKRLTLEAKVKFAQSLTRKVEAPL